MRHHKSQPTTSFMRRLDRSGLAGIGVSILLLCLGVSTLLKGQLHYANYWGGAVFAPFAILIGVLGIYVAIVSRRKQGR
jgi:hypothetical protein